MSTDPEALAAMIDELEDEFDEYDLAAELASKLAVARLSTGNYYERMRKLAERIEYELAWRKDAA